VTATFYYSIRAGLAKIYSKRLINRLLKERLKVIADKAFGYF
jgi:hypothetical protein